MKDTFGSQLLKIICCELEFGGEGFFQDPDHNSLSKIWKLNVWNLCFQQNTCSECEFGQETLFCWLWEVKTPNSKRSLTNLKLDLILEIFPVILS